MLHNGVIQPSYSLYTLLMLLVKKKGNSWRFSIDYRKFSDLTIKNKFSIPLIDELMDKLYGF